MTPFTKLLLILAIIVFFAFLINHFSDKRLQKGGNLHDGEKDMEITETIFYSKDSKGNVVDENYFVTRDLPWSEIAKEIKELTNKARWINGSPAYVPNLLMRDLTIKQIFDLGYERSAINLALTDGLYGYGMLSFGSDVNNLPVSIKTYLECEKCTVQDKWNKRNYEKWSNEKFEIPEKLSPMDTYNAYAIYSYAMYLSFSYSYGRFNESIGNLEEFITEWTNELCQKYQGTITRAGFIDENEVNEMMTRVLEDAGCWPDFKYELINIYDALAKLIGKGTIAIPKPRARAPVDDIEDATIRQLYSSFYDARYTIEKAFILNKIMNKTFETITEPLMDEYKDIRQRLDEMKEDDIDKIKEDISKTYTELNRINEQLKNSISTLDSATIEEQSTITTSIIELSKQHQERLEQIKTLRELLSGREKQIASEQQMLKYRLNEIETTLKAIGQGEIVARAEALISKEKLTNERHIKRQAMEKEENEAKIQQILKAKQQKKSFDAWKKTALADARKKKDQNIESASAEGRRLDSQIQEVVNEQQQEAVKTNEKVQELINSILTAHSKEDIERIETAFNQIEANLDNESKQAYHKTLMELEIKIETYTRLINDATSVEVLEAFAKSMPDNIKAILKDAYEDKKGQLKKNE